MHNSLHIRDLLRQLNADPLRIDRRDPHRAVGSDPAARPREGDFALAGAWGVVAESGLGDVGRMAADDLRDFLRRMTGIASGAAGGQTHAIRLVAADDLPPRACRILSEPDEVRIEASDAAGLWAGVAWLEWEMRTRRGPFLPRGTRVRTAAWRTQISQGPWGGNYSVPDFSPEFLGDDAFRLYAHYGVNSMMIYGDMLCYVESEILPELNCPDYARNVGMLKDAARRAAAYGVRFTYVVVGPKLRAEHPIFERHPGARGSGMKSLHAGHTIHCLCSSDEECLAFYGETFEKLFREVPELAGLTLIIGGESFYHCRMWGNPRVRCERCYARDTEDVVAGLVRATAEGVHRAKPEAFVVAWPYNIESWEWPDSVELVRRLPLESGLFHQIDRRQWYAKDGYRKLVWDYSIDYIGPCDDVRRRAAEAKRRRLPLFLKTETGIGLEVFQFPYVPAMQRLADKWQVVRDLAPDGVQQSWLFYGMFGSRAEEVALWAAYGRDIPRDDFLRAMAARDFGPDAADQVLRGWRHMSDAVGHIPCITLTGYYVGPSFLGPCHPLVPEKGATIPDVFHGVLYFLQEGEETFSRARTKIRTSLVMDALPDTARSVAIEWDGPGDGWDIVEREYRRAADDAATAWHALVRARGAVRTEQDARNLDEETSLVELVHRTFATCANTVAFLAARRRHEETDSPLALGRMKEIAAAELANAAAALPVYERCPWLDLSERADGVFSPCAAMIAEKAAWVRRFLAS